MTRQKTPDWILERHALGELGKEEAARLEAHLAANPEEAQRLAAIAASNRALLEQHPPGPALAEIRRKAEATPARRAPRLALVLAPALAVAAALLIVLRPVSPPDAPSVAREEVRLKGLTPQLQVFSIAAGNAQRLTDGAPAHAGEVLQLRYLAAGKTHGVIVSIDGRGGASLHFPEDARGSSALEASGEVTLPHAYQLDDAPRFERFFFVTSGEPISVEHVLAAARAAASAKAAEGKLDLPSGFEQVTFTVRKVEP